VGGTFWDGRATGWRLGDPLAEQALGPFLNPVEQNMPSAAAVCEAVAASEYAGLFEEVWGAGSLDCGDGVAATYDRIGRSISAYERSTEVSPFTSKYDYYLAGLAKLSPAEARGLALFEGKAKCANCHTSRPGRNGEPPLFTDFRYDNIGVPRNPDNPWYTMPAEFNRDGVKWVDPGLAEFLAGVPQYAMYAKDNLGKHRAPTVRNVDVRPTPSYVKAFGHNGYFKSLEAVVHFYNTRDVLPAADKVKDPKPGVNCWPAPEVRENLNTTELGNLGLTAEEEAAVVAFLKALSDGYQPT
jgi:cytochrome c peroxidase